MIIRDPIYGKYEIRDSVLLELIRSRPLQRLRWISQQGVINAYSRYEHSVGVMLLLRRYGAGIEEQAAGLLHDVSHTAFSHVIDWVLDKSASESYQDSTLAEHIMRPEISGVLKRHGLDANRISELEENGKYPLLERKIPLLCADRLDYSLRDAFYFLNADTKYYLKNLIVKDSEFMFTSEASARKYGYLYMKLQRERWGSAGDMARYYLLSSAIREEMGRGVLSMEDLYKKEEAIISKMKRLGNEREKKLLSLAFGSRKVGVSHGGDVLLEKKRRYVDPKFIRNGRVCKLSASDVEFKRMIDKEKSSGSTVKVRIEGI